MRIILLNDNYFLSCLRRNSEHEVFFVSPSPGADLEIGPGPLELQDVVNACPFTPDVILFSDSIDVRPAIIGYEKILIPKVFYGVDSPMNYFWQKDFVQAFDLSLLDQKEPVDRIHAENPDLMDYIHWLPLAADTDIYQNFERGKEYDISFVGSLNQLTRPKRSWMLAELRRHFKVHVFDGGGKRALTPSEVVDIYNRSKIVINENLFPGINLRTLEVMASGACLLTEEGDGSWRSFFRELEHLMPFKPENLITRAQKLLENDDLRERIARTGMSCVRREHSIQNRTDQLIEMIEKHLLNHNISCDNKGNSYHLGRAFLQLADRWPRQPVGKLAAEGAIILRNQSKSGYENPELYFELAAKELQAGQPEDARDFLHRALALDQAHLRSNWALFWCNRELGDAIESQNILFRFCRYLRFEEVDEQILAELSSGNPLKSSHYLLLGRLMESAGWLLEPGFDRMKGHPCRWNAFDAYQHAFIDDRNNWRAYLSCAELLEKIGTVDFAAIMLERAANLRPGDKKLAFRLVKALLDSYRRQEGLEHLERYLVNFTDSEKWEMAESLALSETERQHLLDGVLNICRNSENGAKTTNQKEEINQRSMTNLARLEIESPNAAGLNSKDWTAAI